MPTQFLPEVEFARAGPSFHRPVIWSLWTDGIRVAAPGAPPHCHPYATLTAIRLFAVAVKNTDPVHHCTLTFQNGRTLDFTNFQMVAPGQFVRQDEGYRAFVLTLVQQARQQAPHCQLQQGAKPGLYRAAQLLAGALLPVSALYFYTAWQRQELAHAATSLALLVLPLLAVLRRRPRQLAWSAVAAQLPASAPQQPI